MSEAIGAALIDAFYVTGSTTALSVGEWMVTNAAMLNVAVQIAPCYPALEQRRQAGQVAPLLELQP